MSERKKHWYFITTFECVLSGCTTVYRERRYGRRPKKWKNRHAYETEACYSCQYALFM